MKMNFKISSSVKLNYDQVLELQSVFGTPDMGWGVDNDYSKMNNVYLVENQGEHGTYSFRVNLKKELITLLSVK